jgi:pSer/pThr/pTyr-binding forkhead associated (FHA) protein
MAGENSELTFVRCPSCRSLVPAISTKCRMCGATFDNAQSEEDKSKAQGRARQHTATINGADDHDDTPPIAAKPTAPPVAPTAQFKNARADSLPNGSDVDDPLRNYLEEVEVEDHHDDNQDVDNGSAYAPPVKAAAPPPPPPAPKEVRSPQPPPAPTKAPAAPNQVVVESGRGRPGGLSFGKPDNREAKKVEPAQQQEVKREQPVRPPAPPVAPKPNFNRPEPQAQRAPQPPKEERREERQEARPVERRPEPTKPAPTPSSKPVIHEGDLVGWLVDYKDPRGMGIEIRESQFFVSRERLKASDMVLEDESISTPHALVRITRQNGVEVQDLMSESGIRIRRRDSNSWQTLEERVKLQHGDRVQFGKVEYLIVLVPVD